MSVPTEHGQTDIIDDENVDPMKQCRIVLLKLSVRTVRLRKYWCDYATLVQLYPRPTLV